MIAHRLLDQSRRLAAAATMAVAIGSIMVSAASTPVKLVGVSSHDNAVFIEATEPAAYAVSRPDPLTLIVDLRNVSVAGVRADVARAGSLAGIRLEQAIAADGGSLARVRVSLTHAAGYQVRSARNTIRLELTPAQGPIAAAAAPQTALSGPMLEPGPATRLDKVQARRAPGSATLTFSGNGQLVPSSVAESTDAPRRLTLDFPNVTWRAGRVGVDGTLVRKLRVSVASRAPLVTRAILELGDQTTYHVERSGPGGRDLDLVFETATGAGERVPLALADGQAAPADAPITMAEAMRNVAAITPADPVPPEPTRALLAAPSAQAAPSAPPAQVGTPLPQTVSGEPKRFTGHPVSLDFQGADLRAVLRGFSEISGLNMVIDPDVQGSVDIILNEVPWDQALDVILRGNQLDYTVDGTIVRIARVDTLRKEQDSRQALAKSAAEAGTLAVRTFPLSYARASVAAPLVKKAVLSARGDVQIDDRTNTLIITDLQARLDGVSTLLATLDRAEPQVEVEARIVQTSRDFARAIGVQWGLNGRVSPELGNTTPLAFPNSGALNGRLGDNRALNIPAANATSAIGLALGAVNGAFSLDVALSALEHSGKGRILSTPRLTTQNNVQAEVEQGIQVPITTPGTVSQPPTVTFKDATLKLTVTPQITAARTVIMKIVIENSAADFSRSVNGTPPINTQRANTQVQINDGATTVIGGIFVSEQNSSTDGIPLLSRLPLMRWLFKRDTTDESSRELLIFITPRILKD